MANPITWDEFLKSWSEPKPNSIPASSIPRCSGPSSAARASLEEREAMVSRSAWSGEAPSFSSAASSMQAAKWSPIFWVAASRTGAGCAASSSMPQRYCALSSLSLA